MVKAIVIPIISYDRNTFIAQTKLEKLARNKHSSLFGIFDSDGRSFIDAETR
jgi:hypothetical protein